MSPASIPPLDFGGMNLPGQDEILPAQALDRFVSAHAPLVLEKLARRASPQLDA
jgi:hypothetical protein